MHSDCIRARIRIARNQIPPGFCSKDFFRFDENLPLSNPKHVLCRCISACMKGPPPLVSVANLTASFPNLISSIQDFVSTVLVIG